MNFIAPSLFPLSLPLSSLNGRPYGTRKAGKAGIPISTADIAPSHGT